MAKMYGDVSQHHRDLAAALEDHEMWLDKKKSTPISPAAESKFCVCLAHDWYAMGMDEEGERLFNRAQKACPSYFKKEIFTDIKADPDFAYLIYRLQHVIAADVLLALGVK